MQVKDASSMTRIELDVVDNSEVHNSIGLKATVHLGPENDYSDGVWMKKTLAETRKLF